MEPTEWENIFTNSTSVRGLKCKICKEFKKFDFQIPNNPVKNCLKKYLQLDFMEAFSQMRFSLL